MEKVEVSTPGKLMLFGEHAVVYGRPCIVTAVDRRMKVKVEPMKNQGIEIAAPDVGVEKLSLGVQDLESTEIPKGARFIVAALRNFSRRYGVSSGIKVTTESEFSSEFGFGSSSAVTVGTIAALSWGVGENLSKEEMFRLAYQSVLDVQGVGSGFDIAAAVWGGTLSFIAGGREVVPLLAPRLPLVVGYTGIKADTTVLVKDVARKREVWPNLIDGVFDLMAVISKLAKEVLEKGEWDRAGDLMNSNQGLLEALGVSTIELSRLIFSARQAGAWGAKLSGAGGGDCMISLAEDEEKVERAIRDAGGVVIKVRTGTEGVRREEI